jgi:hypothetical protein
MRYGEVSSVQTTDDRQRTTDDKPQTTDHRPQTTDDRPRILGEVSGRCVYAKPGTDLVSIPGRAANDPHRSPYSCPGRVSVDISEKSVQQRAMQDMEL